jgi:hypothetical protein
MEELWLPDEHGRAFSCSVASKSGTANAAKQVSLKTTSSARLYVKARFAQERRYKSKYRAT